MLNKKPIKPVVVREEDTENPDIESGETEVTEPSAVQAYFDSLDDTEKEELCAIAEEYKMSKASEEEIDINNIVAEEDGE